MVDDLLHVDAGPEDFAVLEERTIGLQDRPLAAVILVLGVGDVLGNNVQGLLAGQNTRKSIVE